MGGLAFLSLRAPGLAPDSLTTRRPLISFHSSRHYPRAENRPPPTSTDSINHSIAYTPLDFLPKQSSPHKIPNVPYRPCA